jgi:hypothetical protein
MDVLLLSFIPFSTADYLRTPVFSVKITMVNELLNISDAIKITFAQNALPVAFSSDTHLR